jgi:hypothetical protein
MKENKVRNFGMLICQISIPIKPKLLLLVIAAVSIDSREEFSVAVICTEVSGNALLF